MFERTNKIDQFKWTARSFEIISNDININDIVLNFVSPSIELIKHSENKYAERWYWSWKKEVDTNLFCRLYFLTKPEYNDNIWKTVEEIREKSFENKIKAGIEEPTIQVLNDETLELEVILEYFSEIALMVWKGTSEGTTGKYIKSFHHLFEPLLINDQEAFNLLNTNIGKGILR